MSKSERAPRPSISNEAEALNQVGLTAEEFATVLEGMHVMARSAIEYGAAIQGTSLVEQYLKRDLRSCIDAAMGFMRSQRERNTLTTDESIQEAQRALAIRIRTFIDQKPYETPSFSLTKAEYILELATREPWTTLIFDQRWFFLERMIKRD